MTFTRGKARSAVMLAGVIALTGCATPANRESMMPATVKTVHRHPQSVLVEVTGGRDTEPKGKPQISSSSFRQALADSISDSKTFARVVQVAGGDYVLTVKLSAPEQPSFALNTTVKLEALWTLRRPKRAAPVWQATIRSEHTTAASEAFGAVTRIKLATEGAARENIAAGLAQVSQLDLQRAGASAPRRARRLSSSSARE